MMKDNSVLNAMTVSKYQSLAMAAMTWSVAALCMIVH